MLPRCKGTPRRVKLYEPDRGGQEISSGGSGIFGRTAGFCYGDKTVDSIVKWTEHVTTGAYSQTEVSYTYKIANLAPWAERSDVQRGFRDVRTTVPKWVEGGEASHYMGLHGTSASGNSIQLAEGRVGWLGKRGSATINQGRTSPGSGAQSSSTPMETLCLHSTRYFLRTVFM